MATTIARNGAEALVEFRRQQPSLVVLDVGLPELDGLEVCRRLRETSQVPILFLSARDEEVDRIVGLELGADDYVTKPFSPRELVARVKAILKRVSPLPGASTTGKLEHGLLQLDRGAHQVRYGGRPVELTALEFAILTTLVSRPEMVFSRDQLINAAYGPGMHVADRTIDSHIRNIRAKFASAGCSSVVATIHGIGFRLAEAAA